MFTLSNGRRVACNGGPYGLTPPTRLAEDTRDLLKMVAERHGVTGYAPLGFDDVLPEPGGPAFTLDERAEIAVYMIMAWQRWLETGSPYPPDTTAYHGDAEGKVVVRTLQPTTCLFTVTDIQAHIMSFAFAEGALISPGRNGHLHIYVAVHEGFNPMASMGELAANLRELLPAGISFSLEPLVKAHPAP